MRPGDEKLLFKFGKYPETELTRFERFSEFSKSNIAKPDGSKFITFYQNYDQYKMFNSGGELLKEVQIEDSSISKSNDTTYRSVFYASNKYIYSAEIYESTDSLKENGASFRSSLEVWNWAGEPVYRAKFDRSIQQFTVSEKHKKLYGTSLENRNIVFEYDLPDVLDLD